MKRSSLCSLVVPLACALLCAGCLSTAKPPVASAAAAAVAPDPEPRKQSWTDPKTGAAMSSIRTKFLPR